MAWIRQGLRLCETDRLTTKLSGRGNRSDFMPWQTNYGCRGPLQRLDNHHVLDWDGPVLSQVVDGLNAEVSVLAQRGSFSTV